MSDYFNPQYPSVDDLREKAKTRPRLSLLNTWMVDVMKM